MNKVSNNKLINQKSRIKFKYLIFKSYKQEENPYLTNINDNSTVVHLQNESKWGVTVHTNDGFHQEQIGTCDGTFLKEKNIKILLITWVFIDEKYRHENLCYELVKTFILKYESQKCKGKIIKVVIAGGIAILKCLLKVLHELKYNIKKYEYDCECSDDKKVENIKFLKEITYEEAIMIEKRNYKDDKWQTLFFSK